MTPPGTTRGDWVSAGPCCPHPCQGCEDCNAVGRHVAQPVTVWRNSTTGVEVRYCDPCADFALPQEAA